MLLPIGRRTSPRPLGSLLRGACGLAMAPQPRSLQTVGAGSPPGQYVGRASCHPHAEGVATHGARRELSCADPVDPPGCLPCRRHSCLGDPGRGLNQPGKRRCQAELTPRPSLLPYPRGGGRQPQETQRSRLCRGYFPPRCTHRPTPFLMVPIGRALNRRGRRLFSAGPIHRARLLPYSRGGGRQPRERRQIQ